MHLRRQLMARFVLRDGTTNDVAPRDYSYFEDRPGAVWCALCQSTIPGPTHPVNAVEFDNTTARMKHAITHHNDRRSLS